MLKALKNLVKITLVALIFTANSFSTAVAQGNLLITPKRVVFDGSKRSEIVNLANIGKDTARYAVSFIQIRMKDDGSFEQITTPDPGQNFSDKNLRIFPRTVTLAPNEAQVVKIQVSQFEKLFPGEYRSHLYFRAITEESPLGSTSEKTDSASVSVRLTPVFGISIPVIIRSGATSSKVNLSNLQLETFQESQKILSVRFNRSGNISTYGDLTVQHVSNTGKKTQVGLVKGISVYTPNTTRNVRIKLSNEPGTDLNSGKLIISYKSSDEGKKEVLATSELILN